jgi:putative membrane protein
MASGGSRGAWDEARTFWGEVFAWQGSVTSRVLPRVALFGGIAALVYFASRLGAPLGIPVGPHEIAGTVLGVILVLRTNAGYERWWEGRRLWGGIVNQTRNLATAALSYGPSDPRWREEVVYWTIAYAHAARRSLRGERELPEVAVLVGPRRAARVEAAFHMPTAVARRIGRLLHEALEGGGLDGFAFQEAERQRALLIDHLGGCERILKTPLPRVYAIEIRRFIALFLVSMTFALISKGLGWVTPLLTALVAYAVLTVDLIGAELQNPFAPHSLGALPLDDICGTIERDLRGLLAEDGRPAEDEAMAADPVLDAVGDPDLGAPPTSRG